MNNYCQVLLTFILQCEDYKTTKVNTLRHNELQYVPKTYTGLKKVEARISSRGDIRYVVPFIAFLGDNQAVKKGYYPVFLYYRKNKKLILAYGLSVTSQGELWDFKTIGITQPQTIGQVFGTEVHDTKYDTSYVHSVYDVSNVVNHFRNIDVANDTIYQTEAVTNYGFEKIYTIDNDLTDICNKYIKQLGMVGNTTASISSIASGVVASTEPFPHNIILFGPPGTGKTYSTVRYAVSIIDGIDIDKVSDDNKYTDAQGKVVDLKAVFDSYLQTNQIRFTTFHQSLSYEDFIEGIRPEYDSGNNVMTYPVKPGIFKQMCDDARGKMGNYVLIIDEINRGNVAQIFGELITLIEEDKREGGENTISVTLPYSSSFDPQAPKFTVPSNLYILGTMNTADRSVEALDSALRRRFSFVEMRPAAEKTPDTIFGTKISPREIIKKINSRLEVLKDTEHQIGHSYFMEVDSVEMLMDVFRHKVIPLLQEYFFGDMERIKMIIGDGFFVTQKNIKSTLFPNYKGDVDFPEEILQIWDDSKWTDCVKDKTHADFLKAINILMQ